MFPRRGRREGLIETGGGKRWGSAARNRSITAPAPEVPAAQFAQAAQVFPWKRSQSGRRGNHRTWFSHQFQFALPGYRLSWSNNVSPPRQADRETVWRPKRSLRAALRAVFLGEGGAGGH